MYCLCEDKICLFHCTINSYMCPGGTSEPYFWPATSYSLGRCKTLLTFLKVHVLCVMINSLHDFIDFRCKHLVYVQPPINLDSIRVLKSLNMLDSISVSTLSWSIFNKRWKLWPMIHVHCTGLVYSRPNVDLSPENTKTKVRIHWTAQVSYIISCSY